MVKKTYIVLLAAACTFAFGSLALLAEPFSTTASFSIGEVSISLCYDEGVLKIVYFAGEKECQLAFSAPQRMGLLIEVAGAEIVFSLKFLEEKEIWPDAEALKDEYTLKSRFEVPGWVVVVVGRPPPKEE